MSERTSVLDAPHEGRRRGAALAGVGAAALHAGFALLAVGAGARVAHRAIAPPPVTQMIDVDMPAHAEEENAPKKAPEPAPRARPVRAADEPPPVAARAGQVLAAADNVVDFGDTIVAGTGVSYAGGVTASKGTATHAVRDPGAQAGGVEGGAGTDPLGDRSRPPALAAGNDWDCPFPWEADDAGIDHAVVTLRVSVGADGQVADVRATTEPGHGFAREARACALSKAWSPALDRAGRPAAAVTVVNVHFDRGTS